ncbi:hypothetical protein BpHYR1_027718 [Brachionus plicatilis]|uniref:RNA-directed DNA polymerase from mobile element jockey-like n=1 Tax=Brachionus plicatilis TaxID=10195 RepID=A0A3M7SKU3_BRAPC|nr:hypothetical protein BpHYR1_027718 [Brachionus plicatilis]
MNRTERPKLSHHILFDVTNSGIRGHARRLSGQVSTKCLQRANTFTNRIVNEWNALPATVTDADSVNKKSLNTFSLKSNTKFPSFRRTHDSPSQPRGTLFKSTLLVDKPMPHLPPDRIFTSK